MSDSLEHPAIQSEKQKNITRTIQPWANVKAIYASPSTVLTEAIAS